MSRFQFWPRQSIKRWHNPLWLAVASCAWMFLATGSASAQLAANQTNGFGNGRLVTLTYLQNFDCVDEPTMDLDFNKVPAQSGPNEQTPICQAVTEPEHDPTRGDLKHTAHLYVLVPMFGKSTTPATDAMDCPERSTTRRIIRQKSWGRR